MPSEEDDSYLEYWDTCWPDALLNVLRDFMEKGDSAGVLGISSLAVCHRQCTDYEAAVSSLIREILHGFGEAKNTRKDLKKRETELREKYLYDVMEKRATLLEAGLVPLPRLEKTIVGFRRKANQIYSAMRDAGLLKIESHALRASGEPLQWVGLNTKWDSVVEDITAGEHSNEMFASSLGVMLCMATDKRGITTVLPMARAIIIAEKHGGEINYEDLKPIYRNVKALNVILERQREKVEALKIFPSDDGKRLIVSRKTAYGVKIWLEEANRLFQTRNRGG